MTIPSNDTLVQSLAAICRKETASNPVAWHNLHRAGLTVAALKAASASPDWLGPKPVFSKAPSPDSEIWAFLEARQ